MKFGLSAIVSKLIFSIVASNSGFVAEEVKVTFIWLPVDGDADGDIDGLALID